MKVKHSKSRAPTAADPKVAKILREVSPKNLRAIVERLAFPRDYTRNKRANRRARDLLLEHARSLGYAPALQGRFDNIMLATRAEPEEPYILLGAHYEFRPRHAGSRRQCQRRRGLPRMRPSDQEERPGRGR